MTNKKDLYIIIVILALAALGVAGYSGYKYLLSTAPSPSAPPIVTAKCVEKSSLNCTNEVELSYECTDEYQNWARANCPGWEERVYCNDPRPEVCTMECIQNPPYICGSDGRSHCSICQACSDRNIAWYEIKTSPCGEGQFCGGIAANLPENQCPDGFYCKLDGNYPDASGVCTKLTEQIPPIFGLELSRGWYYGTKDQKKPNTPTSWINTEAGRSSCWHKPEFPCPNFPPD